MPSVYQLASHGPDTMFFVLMDSTGLIRADPGFAKIYLGVGPAWVVYADLGLTLSFHSDHRTECPVLYSALQCTPF